MNHPSDLALDELVLGVNTAVAAHVDSCNACSAYVAERRVWAKETMPATLVTRAQQRRQPHWFAGFFAMSLAAAAAGLVFYVQVDDYVGAKGSPAVAMFVEHSGAVKRWDRNVRIVPGDRLQLEVAPKRYRSVTVFVREEERWTSLYSGTLDKPQPLPLSLVVDAEPGDERVAVVLSQKPLSTELTTTAMDNNRRDEEVWVTTFTLSKEVAR